MQNRLKPLISLPFVVCLLLLIINDFYLKAAFHNTLTGKLSDICGLFIFPIFWSVLFPRQKSWVFILTGAFFVYWKSEFSVGFIQLVSAYFFNIGRVIDATDLIALPVLGLAWLQLKADTKAVNTEPSLTNLSPYIVAIITIFSFCATSQVRYVQTFEQPQYVLFKTHSLPDSGITDEGLNFYRFDSLLVVQVNDLYTSDRPVKNDDYSKNMAAKDLDKNIAGFIPGITGLMDPKKRNTLTIKTPQGDDIANFKGSRLDGAFVRMKNGKELISGLYKMGLEDGTWTFRDTTENQVTKVTFVNGERTRVQQFTGGKLISSSKVNTRADVIVGKIIQIIALTLLMIGAIIILVINYRRKPIEKPHISSGWKWMVCLVTPLAVWLVQLLITQLLGDYHFDLLFVPVSIFLIYIITSPLLFIIVFGFKLSRQIDVLWYGVIFALALCIWNEYDILTALSV
jgi:hypothetical protein